MKKVLSVMLCLVIISSALFAAGGSEAAPATKEDPNLVKIALIIENTIDDKGWCQAMHDGILEAQTMLPRTHRILL